MTEDELIRSYKKHRHTGEIALQLNSGCRRLRKIRSLKYLLSLRQFTGATAVLLGTKETSDRVKNSWRPPTLSKAKNLSARRLWALISGCSAPEYLVEFSLMLFKLKEYIFFEGQFNIFNVGFC